MDLFGIVGTVIASAYHVESVVAEGGFGIVYRARHDGFRATVALKCLKVPQHLGSEQQRRFIEHFRAEGEVLFRLSASIPNVVRPLHVDVMNTRAGTFMPYLVLEWLEGETLDAILRARVAAGKRALAVPEALELLEPVARALERAHHFEGSAGRESIAHCDLKPENVFVAKVGGERLVKILDFGVAKVRSAATRAAATAPGTRQEIGLFTPAYGAPEQWSPQALGETGPWTDVWGLALTLVETLVGRPVVAGDRESMQRTALDRGRRPTPSTNGVAVGDALEAVLLRALAVDPRERYPDAGAFWRAAKGTLTQAVEIRTASQPEIPDLDPVARKPSGAQKLELGAVRKPSGAQKLELGAVRKPSGAQKLDLGAPLSARPAQQRSPSGAQRIELAAKSASGTHALNLPTIGSLDFDDDASGEGSGIALDLLPEELIRTGSLAPLPEAPNVEGPVSARSPFAAQPVISHAPKAGGAPAVSVPPAPVSAASPMPSLAPAPEPNAPAVPSPAPALSVPRSPPPVEIQHPLARRALPGLALAGTSIAVTLLDRVYATAQGEVFALGPIRTSWIAAVLLVAGLALVVRELIPKR